MYSYQGQGKHKKYGEATGVSNANTVHNLALIGWQLVLFDPLVVNGSPILLIQTLMLESGV